MEIYIMKQKAIDYLKENMLTLHSNYYKFIDNDWIYKEFDYDPFEFFMDIPDFELTPLDNRGAGEIELENCKILYEHLKNLSQSNASDERLWAGLCNGVFYKYVRNRWKYPSLVQKDPKSDASAIISRFFFSGGTRSGLFRNTLAKCWWVGQATYDGENSDKWHMLDSIGYDDFSTKVSDILYSNTFAANKNIMRGICKGLDFYRKNGVHLIVKDHIRPTMQYLNALGGTVLLDMYSDEEIANEVITRIQYLMNEKDDTLDLADATEESEDNVIDDGAGEYSSEINVDFAEYESDLQHNVAKINIRDVMIVPDKVMYGCKVKLEEVRSGNIITPFIPEAKGKDKLAELPRLAMGKKVGDSFKFKGKEYVVVEIAWKEK